MEDDGEERPIGPPRPPAGTEGSKRELHGSMDGGRSGPPRPCSGDDDEDEEVMIGPPRPSTMQRDETEEKQTIDEGVMIGPPPPPPTKTSNTSSDDDDDNGGDEDASGDEESPDIYHLPARFEIVLEGHTKVVSTLAVDPTGSRVLTGSYDYSVRMYDFQGMDSKFQSFRQFEPSEGHQVRALSWSPTADRFLCATGSSQAKIYDRDGITLGEFMKGDMYIRDLKNTKGHICGLTGGEWHPRERQTVLTASEDGSLRIWDVDNFDTQKQVIKPKLARPGRVPVTACCWGLQGKCVLGGLGNGSIQVWNVKGYWGARPDIYIENAHENGEDISGLCISANGQTLLSRSTDSTLKVWDLRQIKSPLKVFSGLMNSYAQTNVGFSPDEQLFFTGTSVDNKGSGLGGFLCFFDKQHLGIVRRIQVSATESVIHSAWHPRLNQIFASSGDKKRGGTHIMYDPAISFRGALVSAARAPKKKPVEGFNAQPMIHHPHALPLFRDEPSRKRKKEKERKDPMKSRRPDLPVTGPGFGGRVGTTKGSLLTQYLMKEGGLIKETWMEEDPREAILKHAEAASKDPKYIAPAYAETQPETIFASSDSEEEK